MINLDATAGTAKSYEFDENLAINKINNVIGFNLIRAGVKYGSNNYLSFDLIIDEIPDKACKLNIHKDNIIDSIPVYKDNSDIVHYVQSEIPENYFFPISLDKLTITLKSWTGSTYNGDTTSTVRGYLEFEIVTIKNTENFNKPNK